MRAGPICRLLSVGSLLSFGSTAAAQATRTWVSGVGDDANPCSRTAPCKTFAGAISKTAAGGEIDALDPGGYGAVTITKAIIIDGHGSYASVLASGTNGIVVNAGASDVVVLRGLNFHGSGTGLNGIRFLAGKALHVEDCEIVSFQATSAGNGYGIDFSPAAAAQLVVRNTLVHENGVAGIHVAGTGARAVLEKVTLADTLVGLHAASDSKVTVHDSVVSGNTGSGILADGTSEVNVDRSVVANNGTGIQGTSLVRISAVMTSHNTTGVAGNVTSFGNNRIAAGNGTDGAPTSTIPEQ
jgi:nitrous oxidase accessory protein NosD